MSSSVELEAQSRADIGKGASRRLRRLENKVPAVLYGGDKDPVSITLMHNKVLHALEQESIFSSVFKLKVDGTTHNVILKDLQRHPYKPLVMHIDFQRVSAKETIVKSVPIHFINEENCVGVKSGGIISHNMTEVEVKCLAQDLPEFIEVDMAPIGLETVLHLSELSLPKGVELTADLSDAAHDHPVVAIHVVKAAVENEETPEQDGSESNDTE